MKNLIQAAVVTLFAASAAQAQQAVQWKVSDGGNGHWYQLVTLPGEIRATWDRGDESARERGGYLVTINTDIENAFVSSNFRSRMIDPWSCWIGGFLAANCEWRWVTGEPFDCAAMPVTTYPDWTCPRDCYEDRLYTGSFGDDVYLCIDNHMSGWQGGKRQMLIEWSADCNSDGIIDYGQCRDGTLPDFDGDNVPDCCERGEACVVGNYPVQWRIEDGGNGHWYQWRGWGIEPTFDGATAQAMQLGGHLATVVSDAEAAAVLSIVSDDSCEPQYGGAIWLGARQQPGQTSPGSGWSWVTAEPWSYERWRSGEPNDFQGVQEDRLVFSKVGGHWLDVPDHPVFSPPCVFGLLVEWSADCNADGIVDYGQILDGTLTDVNADGIPDVCQAPCVSADLNNDRSVDGADLGVLLSAWGPAGPEPTRADINGNGIVDGADLGVLLANWGACGEAPPWATVVQWQPDPAVVTNPVLRDAISATGLPWRVKDTATQIEMLLIPPGEFTMGCSASAQHGCAVDEHPIHQVTLTNALYLGRYEVTQAQWQATMGSNPSNFSGFADSDRRPVEQVSWNIIQGFLGATGMRLPTEAEWEYACRGGTTTAFHGWHANPGGTNEDSEVGAIAWYGANSGGQTHPIGTKAANGYGLHDMSGNVWEWTGTRYGDYDAFAQTNPTGPSLSEYIVLRGGAWADGAQSVRCSNRGWGGIGALLIGFRVARNP